MRAGRYYVPGRTVIAQSGPACEPVNKGGTARRPLVPLGDERFLFWRPAAISSQPRVECRALSAGTATLVPLPVAGKGTFGLGRGACPMATADSMAVARHLESMGVNIVRDGFASWIRRGLGFQASDE